MKQYFLIGIIALLLLGFTSMVSAPIWSSAAASDFNTGTGFDFNWTKVTWDGNIMPVGDDRIHNDQNQAFYDVNLKGYWKFDDTNATGNGVTDDTNNANNALLINGAGITAWGMWDTNAGFFDEVNDYVQTQRNNMMDNPPQFTICAWVLHTTTASDDSIAGVSASADNGWVFFRDDAMVSAPCSGTDGFSLYIGDGNDAGSARVCSASGTAAATKKWNHVCGTFVMNSAIGLNIYLNGDIAATAVSTTAIDNIDAGVGYRNLFIGKRDTSGVYFAGAIEEVKYYDRALSAAEIQADYNSWMHSSYLSPVKDAGEAVNWDAMDWNAFVDVNNNVTVDYRGCSAADCSTAGDWQTNLRGNSPGTGYSDIYADNNRYFQYRVNFDTNKQQWNPYRNGNADKGAFGHFSNITVTYSSGEPPADSCSCPASGHWQIINGDACTLTTECNLGANTLHIVNGSLRITSTGVLRFAKMTIENANAAPLSIDNGGQLIGT